MNDLRERRDPDPEDEPPSLDASAWSVAAPPTVSKHRKAVLVLRVLAAVLVLAGPALSITGQLWGDRSMDLPWGDQVRVGLYRNGLPVHWVCGDGHDHFSAPFWLASVAISSGGLLVWWLSGRRKKRAG
jgi:hypothetical protein